MPPPEGNMMDALAHRIVPVMQEHGLSAFVLVGYLEDGDGKLQRVCIANTMRNPAFEDGLRPAMHFAHMWCGPAVPPPTPSP